MLTLVQVNIRQIRAGDPRVQQCLVLYDVALLNGRVLTSLPLKVGFTLNIFRGVFKYFLLQERVTILAGLVRLEEGRVMLCERRVATSGQEVVTSLNTAIDRREEVSLATLY